jgi:hypothetical protein
MKCHWSAVFSSQTTRKKYFAINNHCHKFAKKKTETLMKCCWCEIGVDETFNSQSHKCRVSHIYFNSRNGQKQTDFRAKHTIMNMKSETVINNTIKVFIKFNLMQNSTDKSWFIVEKLNICFVVRVHTPLQLSCSTLTLLSSCKWGKNSNNNNDTDHQWTRKFRKNIKIKKTSVQLCDSTVYIVFI